jgi:hypothetical protein
MTDPLGFYIYNSHSRTWLADDEKSFTSFFHHAASFANLETANAVMEREGGDYVLACMPSP